MTTEFEDDGLSEGWEAGVECMPGSRDRYFIVYQGIKHLKLKGPDTGDDDEGYSEDALCEKLAEFGYSAQSAVIMMDAARARAERLPKPDGRFEVDSDE